MNSLFFNNFNNSKLYSETPRRHPVAKRLLCERVVAMDVYMLCPQHRLLFQAPDVERFVNWGSELYMAMHGIKRIEYKQCPGNAGMGFELIASAKCNDKSTTLTGIEQ